MSQSGGSQVADSLRYPIALLTAHLLLMLAEDRNHGYELMARLRDLGAPMASTSSIYRELGKLECAGLVTSFWEATQTRGPARRVYVITPAGRATLRACARAAVDLGCCLEDFVLRERALRQRRRI